MYFCQNVWVSKSGVSKCPGVEMSGAEMSENPEATPTRLPNATEMGPSQEKKGQVL